MELIGGEQGFHTIRVANIEGMAHLIPVEETSSSTELGQSECSRLPCKLGQGSGSELLK